MNFIRMLEESEISVNLISPEVISDMVSKIAPEQNPKQRQFYSERRAARYTELDQEPTGRTILEGDPGLYYYEFCIAIAKIALEITKDIDEVRKCKLTV